MALASCTFTRDQAQTAWYFQCLNEQTREDLIIKPIDAHHILLNTAGNQYRLTRVATASGVKYQNDTISFWLKGHSAILSHKTNATVAHCEKR